MLSLSLPTPLVTTLLLLPTHTSLMARALWLSPAAPRPAPTAAPTTATLAEATQPAEEVVVAWTEAVLEAKADVATLVVRAVAEVVCLVVVPGELLRLPMPKVFQV